MSDLPEEYKLPINIHYKDITIEKIRVPLRQLKRKYLLEYVDQALAHFHNEGVEEVIIYTAMLGVKKNVVKIEEDVS